MQHHDDAGIHFFLLVVLRRDILLCEIEINENIFKTGLVVWSLFGTNLHDGRQSDLSEGALCGEPIPILSFSVWYPPSQKSPR